LANSWGELIHRVVIALKKRSRSACTFTAQRWMIFALHSLWTELAEPRRRVETRNQINR
jgi:hypothetical protein